MDSRAILIIEDDSLISTFLDAKLKERYKTVVAIDTKEARAALKKQPIHLIVLDILLPEEDGFALLKEIKQTDSPYRDIPVIILSNLDRAEDIEMGKKLGAVDFMVKGNYVPAEIADRIDKIMKQHAGA